MSKRGEISDQKRVMHGIFKKLIERKKEGQILEKWGGKCGGGRELGSRALIGKYRLKQIFVAPPKPLETWGTMEPYD